jgi:hypothetical protein
VDCSCDDPVHHVRLLLSDDDLLSDHGAQCVRNESELGDPDDRHIAREAPSLPSLVRRHHV